MSPCVLVTGASRGLGLEFARQYAADGWHVIATCRDPAHATALTALGVEVLPLDVSDWAQVARLAKDLSGRAVDLLINNAGQYGRSQTLGAIDPQEWLSVLACNTVAPVQLTQALLPNLQAAKDPKVAFVSSMMGSITDNSSGGYCIYRSSKAALNAAVRSLAHDMMPLGISAVLLHPGWVQTDMGGRDAPLVAETSVSGMRRVIAALQHSASGMFLDYTGKALPW